MTYTISGRHIAGAPFGGRIIRSITSTGSTFTTVNTVGDGATDNTAAINAAFTALSPGEGLAFLPGTYLYAVPTEGGAFTPPSNVEIFGFGGPVTIVLTGASGRFMNLTSCSNVKIHSLNIDGDASSKTGSTDAFNLNGAVNCELRSIRFYNATNGFAYLRNGAELNTIADCHITDIGSTAISIDGTATRRNNILNNYIEATFFGVWITYGSYENLVQGNRTHSNGLELVGVTYNSHHNRIIGNHAEGTGDNGISVTGYGNTVVGNIAKFNAFNGIHIYGHLNTVSGNTCDGNAQSTNGVAYAGIAIQPAWGGQGVHNTVSGNTCTDTQATPTQDYGIRIRVHTYSQWVTGETTASMGSNLYRQHLNKVYRAQSVGTCGATAPTHTTGTASDGGVDWLFVYQAPTVVGDLDAWDNTVVGNLAYGNITADVIDQSGNANTVITDSLIKMPVRSTAAPNTITNNFTKINFVSGSPVGTLSGAIGDITVRYSGPKGAVLYVKESGTAGVPDTAEWLAPQLRRSGSTASRPVIDAGTQSGLSYWDTTLNEEIYWNGTAWQNANKVPV